VISYLGAYSMKEVAWRTASHCSLGYGKKIVTDYMYQPITGALSWLNEKVRGKPAQTPSPLTDRNVTAITQDQPDEWRNVKKVGWIAAKTGLIALEIYALAALSNYCSEDSEYVLPSFQDMVDLVNPWSTSTIGSLLVLGLSSSKKTISNLWGTAMGGVDTLKSVKNALSEESSFMKKQDPEKSENTKESIKHNVSVLSGRNKKLEKIVRENLERVLDDKELASYVWERMQRDMEAWTVTDSIRPSEEDVLKICDEYYIEKELRPNLLKTVAEQRKNIQDLTKHSIYIDRMEILEKIRRSKDPKRLICLYRLLSLRLDPTLHLTVEQSERLKLWITEVESDCEDMDDLYGEISAWEKELSREKLPLSYPEKVRRGKAVAKSTAGWSWSGLKTSAYGCISLGYLSSYTTLQGQLSRNEVIKNTVNKYVKETPSCSKLFSSQQKQPSLLALSSTHPPLISSSRDLVDFFSLAEKTVLYGAAGAIASKKAYNLAMLTFNAAGASSSREKKLQAEYHWSELKANVPKYLLAGWMLGMIPTRWAAVPFLAKTVYAAGKMGVDGIRAYRATDEEKKAQFHKEMEENCGSFIADVQSALVLLSLSSYQNQLHRVADGMQVMKDFKAWGPEDTLLFRVLGEKNADHVKEIGFWKCVVGRDQEGRELIMGAVGLDFDHKSPRFEQVHWEKSK